MANMAPATRSRSGFGTSLSTSMCMSNAALAKVQFKIDKERVRHEKEVKWLNKVEKEELKMAQRELEEVKKELHALKAYKEVATQTAFIKFDRVEVKRREQRKKQKEAELVAQSVQEFENDNGQIDNSRNGSDNEDDGDDDQNSSFKLKQRRRSSATGEIFVTLGDIMDHDDVMQKYRMEIVKQRRRSLVGLTGGKDDCDDDDDNNGNKRDTSSKKSPRKCGSKTSSSSIKSWLSNSKLKKQKGTIHNERCKSEKIGGKAAFGNRRLSNENIRNELSSSKRCSSETPRRRSKIGSIGNLVDDIIKEETADEDEVNNDGKDDLENNENDINNNNIGNNQTSHRSNETDAPCRKDSYVNTFPNGVFITSHESDEIYNESTDHVSNDKVIEAHDVLNPKAVGKELRPMTLFEISKMYEKKKAQKMEENENKLMNLQRRNAQREYHQFRFKLQQKEREKQRSQSERRPSIVDVIESHQQQKQEQIDKDEKLTSQILNNNSIPVSSSSPFFLPRTRQQKDNNIANNSSNEVAIPTPPMSYNSGTADSFKSETNSSSPVITPLSTSSPSISPRRDSETSVNGSFTPKTNDQEGSSSTETKPTLAANPLRGLARFRNAAATVAINQKIEKAKTSSEKMQNLPAAIMMKAKGTKGSVPSSFLTGSAFAWTSPRDTSKNETPLLETVHRNPDKVKVRPLKMPLGVQAEQEEKWGELMVNVQYAVYWKVKALREDTGALNSRQMRRIVRENPVPRRPLFPGQCKTTWSMKNYVRQEVGDVLKSWTPESLRRKRSQQLLTKASLPDFVDRVRTTTTILKSFKAFKKLNEDDNNNDNGDLCNNDNAHKDNDDDKDVANSDYDSELF